MATEPDTERETTGEALSPEQEADFEELRSLFSPKQSLSLLDDFAKWLFAFAGTVGVVGTGFGISNGNDLRGDGRKLFAFAVASVGLSLSCAALARMPLPRRVNRYSDESMRDALRVVYVVRGSLLTLGAILFAAGLVLAAFAPLASR
jgi:hypothetical protein